MSDAYRTNPFFRGGWFQQDGSCRFTGRIVGTEATVGSDEVGKLLCLYHASQPRSKGAIVESVIDSSGIERDAVDADFDWLLDRGFLVPAEQYNDAIKQWVENGWRFALYYHESLRETPSESDDKPQVVREARSKRGSSVQETTNHPCSREATVELPPPAPFPDRPLEDVLLQRQTCRNFSGGSISPPELSAILECRFLAEDGVGSTAPDEFHVYPFISRVDGIPSGIYEYRQDRHGLVPIDQSYTSEELDELIVELVIGQPYAKKSAVYLFFTIDFPSFATHDTHPGDLRAVYLLLSRIAHTAILNATALDIGTFQTAAFGDSKVASVLRSERLAEAPGYMLSFGHNLQS